MSDERARIGVIGAGWWACETYLPALTANPRAEIVAVNRLGEAELEEVRARFDVPRAYTDHAAMLATETLDAVVITSPHPLHFSHAKDALTAGCHVLVDKPMTTSADDARTLVALAAEMQRQIIIPYGWNFKDFTRRAMALVEEGGVGEIRHVAVQMASPTRDLFAGEGLVETEGHMFRPPPSTWADPDKAGGYGWGQLSHALGLLFAVTRLTPVEVAAMAGHSPAGVDFYDAAILRCENRATVSISGAATVPKQCGYQLDLRIFGTEGMLLLDVERERMALHRDDGRDTVMDIAPGAGAYACTEPTERLVEIALGHTATSEAPGLVGQRAVEVLDAMYRSALSGRTEAV
ncbi:Gfo/Idh/MocA family oxidoreductase [Acuticoccus sp. MNP-M23]|uniref:Gfo/Idh/MocA family protein n=1 Tax=Acuticoccus sp. MNP-M23 TaxID=3072793 RepID=UPI00281535AF|nr:Gfo/Idh/MocA family oxidoreductase [Acuticoccus sp. MNP-M23]WMS43591.1 Gfo/Idh/MocA family oxidoreductase [Acuticoccus sp. MNP-M23]